MHTHAQPKANCLANITSLVVNSKIRKETIEGVEFTVLPSKTLPPDIVMNGGLYKADDVKATIDTLNMTPVTIGHPQINGKFVDAYDSLAQAKYGLGGAFNKVVGQDANGVWNVEKYIPTEIMLNTQRGKALQAAIDKNEPIHTSTGVYLNRKPCKGVTANSQEYDWEAEIIQFNHDAILLNEPGAATPAQGVGLFVNQAGDEVEVFTVQVNLSSGIDFTQGAEATRSKISEAAKELFCKSEDGKECWVYVDDFNNDTAVICIDDKQFSVSYKIIGDKAEISGDLIEVKREKSYSFGQKIGQIVSKLASYVKSDTIQSDAEPVGNSENVNREGDMEKEDVVKLIAEAVTANTAAIAEMIDQKLAANAQAAQQAEKSQLVEQVVNAGVLQKEAAEGCTIDALKALAANCKQANGLPRAGFTVNADVESVAYDINESRKQGAK